MTTPARSRDKLELMVKLRMCGLEPPAKTATLSPDNIVRRESGQILVKGNGQNRMSKPSDHTKSSHPKTSKVRAQKRGRWAESLTALYLRLTAHQVMARNYKTQVGEIDLIARRANTLSFIEVKARAHATQAAEAISVKQRRRIQRAAEWFLMQNPALQTCDIRFDVALVTGPFRLTMVRDAWRAE